MMHAPFHTLAQRVAEAIRAPGLVAVYVVGSLARGGFVPGASDIDLLAFAAIDRPRLTERLHLVETPLGPQAQLVSTCVRPLRDLYDALGGLETEPAPDVALKTVTALDDLLFLHEHGDLLRGRDVRPLALLPRSDAYRRYLRWCGELAASGSLRSGAPTPRRLAKRVCSHLRDLVFLHSGEIGRPLEPIAAALPAPQRRVASVALAMRHRTAHIGTDAYRRGAELLRSEVGAFFRVCAALDRALTGPTVVSLPEAWPQVCDVDWHTLRFRPLKVS